MDKDKIQAAYDEAVTSSRTVTKNLIAIVRIGGFLTMTIGFLGLAFGIFMLLADGEDYAALVAMGASFGLIVQGAIILLIAEIGWVVRNNSGMLRRISAGLIKTQAEN